jgi:predicted RNA-binding Zn-ribbon protein involved in translation (DUF1610 family)
MGWTLTGINCTHNGLVTQVHARGNNMAWRCPACGHPILFVYRGRGGAPANPAECPGCNVLYHLVPSFGFAPEPPKGQMVQPAPTMQIM